MRRGLASGGVGVGAGGGGGEALFTDDFTPTPFWWQRTPPPPASAPPVDLPADADVVIVGGGYTGLSAAIQTAGGGLRSVVIDAEAAGWGCSTRNGGQVSTSLKPTYPQLAKRYGANAAIAILREGSQALAWIEGFIGEHGIDCDFHKCGRFYGAHTPAELGNIRKKLSAIPDELNVQPRLLTRAEQHAEIATDFYHGGVLYPHHAKLDPARYHRGLLRVARDAGAEIVPHTRVIDIQRHAGGLRITTDRGVISAGKVLVATSGYTSAVTPWQRRRIIPVGSYVIATEPLPPGTAERLLPTDRVITDTRKLVVYYRTCPARRRILFGGRVSIGETDPRTSAALLRREMLRVFPQLATARISHSWMGFVGYTFDSMPHIGVRNGVHYAMGYCGSGVSLSGYFGMRAGRKLLGADDGDTALDGLTFPARLWYRRRPWFLAPALVYYRWRDR